jgi:hypothetical protein
MISPKKEYINIYNYIAKETGLPFSFIVAHAQVESNQNHLAVGKLGEYGLFQFLPSVWKNLMNGKDWKNVNNQAVAYVLHAKYIINTLKLNPLSIIDQSKFLWVWNAGIGNYYKNIMPDTTKNYIKKVLDLC